MLISFLLLKILTIDLKNNIKMLDLTNIPKHDLESLVEKYLPVLN